MDDDEPSWLPWLRPECKLRAQAPNPQNCFSSYQDVTVETFPSAVNTTQTASAKRISLEKTHDNYEACNEMSISAVCDNRHSS